MNVVAHRMKIFVRWRFSLDVFLAHQHKYCFLLRIIASHCISTDHKQCRSISFARIFTYLLLTPFAVAVACEAFELHLKSWCNTPLEVLNYWMCAIFVLVTKNAWILCGYIKQRPALSFHVRNVCSLPIRTHDRLWILRTEWTYCMPLCKKLFVRQDYNKAAWYTIIKYHPNIYRTFTHVLPQSR